MELMNGVNVVNGQNGAGRPAKRKPKLKKAIRRPGELQAALGKLLAKHPGLTPQEIATKLGISRANARMASNRFAGKLSKAKEAKAKETKVKEAKKIQKVKKDVLIGKDSALARLVGNGKTQSDSVFVGLVTNESIFLGLITLLGVSRAEELIAEERVRISRLFTGGAT